MTETRQEQLAAFFDECSRMLRKHPKLFNEQALEHVGVAAGISVRVVRLAARGASFGVIVSEAGAGLFETVARLAGVGDDDGEVKPPFDRNVVALLAGARRGWVRAADRMSEHAAARALMVVKPDGDRYSIVSACPRCATIATRDLEDPAPCACGFVFEKGDTES